MRRLFRVRVQTLIHRLLRFGALPPTAALLALAPIMAAAHTPTAAIAHPCDTRYLSAGSGAADQCAGIFAPIENGTLKNKADALNGTDGSGIGPLWGGGWTEVAVYEDGVGTGLGFSIDPTTARWSVATPLDGDFVIGIKQATEVAFYLFEDRHAVSGGRFEIDPDFHGEGFSNARLYLPKQPRPPEPTRAEIKLDKEAGKVVRLADDTYAVPFTLTVRNAGDERLEAVQISDPLTIFGDQGALLGVEDLVAEGLTPSPDFDGIDETGLLAGTDRLEPGSKGRISFTLRFSCTPGSGPFKNRATAEGTGAVSRKLVSALARVEFACPTESPKPENPALRLGKEGGKVVRLTDDTYAVPFTLTVRNTGDEKLEAVQIADPLTIFGAGGALLGVDDLVAEGLTPNPDFDGTDETGLLAGTDRLEAGSKGRLSFTLRFRCTAGSEPFVNTATAEATGAASRKLVSDVATAGFACPTEPPVPTNPALQLDKEAGEIVRLDQDTFAVPFTLTVRNSGDEKLEGVQITDPLTIFGAAGTLLGVDDLVAEGLTPSPDFDGENTTRLLSGTDRLKPGIEGRISFTLRFSCTADSGPFTNTATAEGDGRDRLPDRAATAARADEAGHRPRAVGRRDRAARGRRVRRANHVRRPQHR